LKRLIKTTLIAASLLLSLGALSLLGINLYVQSPEVQARLRRAVSNTIGCPIDVFRITFSFWGGFHFRDVVIQNPDSPVPFLKAPDLRVQAEFLPLLRKKLIIRQIVLTGAEIRIPIVERPESSQAIAAASASAEGSNPAEPSHPALPAKSAAPNQSATPAKPLKSPSHRKSFPGNFWVEVRKIKIRDGSIYLLGLNDIALGTLRKVESTLEFHKNDYLGKIDISSATLSDSIDLEEISSPVKISGGAVDLDHIVATLSGGPIQGHFHLRFLDAQYPYSLFLDANGVNVNQIVNRSCGILDRAHGLLAAHFEMSGSGIDPSKGKGAGSFEIKNGLIDQFPFLQEMGRWTQIDELKRVELDAASANFSVEGSDININKLLLVSKNCQISLLGVIASAQKLALKGRITVSQFLAQKIPSELQDNFVTEPDSQDRYLDFLVTGSITRPNTDLFDRLVGDKNRLLRRILRSDRKEKHKDKERNEGP
jgi:uncharacterized protein involved in outer membrane biogenesis